MMQKCQEEVERKMKAERDKRYVKSISTTLESVGMTRILGSPCARKLCA